MVKFGKRTAAMTKWMIAASEVAAHDYAFLGCERCEECGRVIAASDCEKDEHVRDLCWFVLDGTDELCELVRTEPDADDLALGNGA